MLAPNWNDYNTLAGVNELTHVSFKHSYNIPNQASRSSAIQVNNKSFIFLFSNF